MLPALIGIELFSPQAIRQLILAIGGAAADATLSTALDGSSEEICSCIAITNQTLDRIDKTLVSGFAGRDVELERIMKAISVAEPEVARISKKLDIQKNERADLVAMDATDLRMPSIATSQFNEFRRLESQLKAAILTLEGLQASRVAREQQLDPKKLFLTTGKIRPGPTFDDRMSGQGALLNPSTSTQPLTDMCAAFDEKIAELMAAIDGFAETAAASLAGVSNAVTSTENEALAAAVEMSDTATAETRRTLEFIDAGMERSFGNVSRASLDLTRDLKQMFGSLADDLFGKLGPTGGFLSQLFGGGSGILSVLGFAGGGMVQPGLPVLVGERGPELLIPAGPSRIMSNHDSRSALNRQNVTVNMTNHFSTDVSNSVRAEILNAAPAIANAASESVFNALRGIRY